MQEKKVSRRVAAEVEGLVHRWRIFVRSFGGGGVSILETYAPLDPSHVCFPISILMALANWLKIVLHNQDGIVCVLKVFKDV